ncbi:MAG TPA: alpha/beta hydrolase [Pirellulaceae bacterium]|jgi:pimeloyl-ACP methyl ester carboxylesterase|nr:alpha/beta hydrolase [Pirellulaceae bacterium]
MMPTSVLRTFFLGILGWVVLGLGIYLIYEWADGVDEPRGPVVLNAEVAGRIDDDPAREGAMVAPANAGDDRAGGWPALLGGIALILLSTVGPYPLILLLSRRGPEDPDPNQQAGKPLSISRPDGSEIHAEIFGPKTGPTIICTHGWSLDRTDWMYLIDRYGSRYRVVVWDLPGLGKSKTATNRDCSLEKYAEDLHSLIGSTGEGATILVGHSIGGMILQTYCRLHPEMLGKRVHGVALVHTTYQNPLTTMLGAPLWTALQKPLIEPLNYLMIGLAPLAWLANWQSYLNGTLHLTSRITSFAGRQTGFQVNYSARLGALAWPAVIARGNLAMMKWEEEPTLPKISVPVLVVGGANDRITKPEASERIASAAPRADLVLLKPGGHLGHWESHDQFLTALDRFVVVVGETAPAAQKPGMGADGEATGFVRDSEKIATRTT